MKPKLTVVLVLRQGGDFHFSDVELLAYHINKNWNGELQTICIMDTINRVVSMENNLTLIPMEYIWNGWWCKMNIFSPSMEKYRPFVYMDLDTAVVGSLNSIFPVENQEQFVTLENVYFPGRIGSGLMWLPKNNDKIKTIWNTWIKNPSECAKNPGGDQSFIENLVKVDSYFEKVQISSFKPLPRQHWLVNLDSRLKIVYFHGYPRIPEAAKRTEWVKKYLQMNDKLTLATDNPYKINKAYVINIKEREDRLELFQSQSFPFKVERFEAIKMTPGIKGCNASHKAILDMEDQLPIAIFEDDCKMVEDWTVVDKAMTELPEDWDLLYVGANLNSPLKPISPHLYQLKDAWTTHGIIYGSQGVVDYIRQNMPKDTTPIDVFYSKDVLTKFNCYVVNPIAAIQRASFSDVNNGHRDYEKLMLQNFEKNTQLISYKDKTPVKPQLKVNDWFADKGDDTCRINYPLTKNSIVFDIGGYEGSFVEKIYNKYSCTIVVFEPVPEYYNKIVERFKGNDNIIVVNAALSNVNGKQPMFINTDKSGFFETSGTLITVDCITLDQAMNDLGVDKINLLKLNIEGAEYDVLDYMIKNDLVVKCDDIQVQFHTFVPNYMGKHTAIVRKLRETHEITYDYPFVWTNYKSKVGSLSQVGQDLFALSMFPEDYKGTFLDVGCNLPDKINNTLLLEQKGWDGFSLDIVDYSEQWKSRKSKFICANALSYSYKELPKTIDYLSLDVEGTGIRFQALKRLIDLGFDFKVITIEHDAYRGFDKQERQPQRQLLQQRGYQLVFPDVHHNGCAFEDWWINPKYIKL